MKKLKHNRAEDCASITNTVVYWKGEKVSMQQQTTTKMAMMSHNHDLSR